MTHLRSVSVQRAWTVGLAASLFATACSDDRTEPFVPVVHHHASSEAGVFANAYLIEGAEAVVAVDATLTVSEATSLRARLETIGKPLAAVLITHGHPDHYNGVSILTGSDAVPVYATAGVDEIIRRDDAEKEAQWVPVFGDEWPTERRFPTHIVDDGQEISLAGLSFEVHDVGPGESHHDSYWVLQEPSSAAFVGDLAFNGVHAYVADGHTSEWLEQLDRLELDLGQIATIYPGHGDPGSSALFEAQRDYLELYRETVRDLAEGEDHLDDAAKEQLTQVMIEHLGNDRLAFLIALGADAVAAELLDE